MTKSIVALFLFVTLGGLWPEDECNCRKPITTRATEGEEETDEARDENRIYKELYGQVADINGKPTAGILVEVYDHPEVVTDESARKRLAAGEIKQRKLASCKTGKEGVFCFEGIEPGKYEVRISDVNAERSSSSGPFEDASFVVTVDPYHPESVDKMIEVFLSLRI